jgi:interferon-induced GTP-binding protein Mx1
MAFLTRVAALAVAHAATTRVAVNPTTAASEFLGLGTRPRVRALLDANEKLRRLQLQGFDFPRIVVIGDQSAGKSSVLEAISGVQLLRGTGVVTRAPIELRLSNSQETTCKASVEADGVQPWEGACESVGEALNATMRALPGLKPSQRGARRGITEEVVHLRVTAPGAPELTLVDLPGLARVATEGQRPDVPELTRRLSKTFIEPSQSIVLVVCACNADLATAEALRLAAEADPDGERTVGFGSASFTRRRRAVAPAAPSRGRRRSLPRRRAAVASTAGREGTPSSRRPHAGVLTKPDLMDPGTESSVQDILRGKVVKLERHGYFVVRNRGQLSRNVTQGQALTDEAQYFSTHSIFGKLAQRGRFGAPALAQYLAEVLQDAIARDVPEARRLVDSKERDVIAKLQALGDAADVDPSKKRARLVRVATDFAQMVQEACSGKSDGERGLTADVLALYRGFDKDVRSRAPSKNASSYSLRVREAVAETRGREAFYGFPSAQVFAGLVADLVDDVRAPAERVVSDVRARVLVAGRAAAATSARRFPALRKKLEELVGDVASEKYEAAKDSVALFLDAQRHPFAQDLLVSEEPTPRPSFRPQSRPTSSNDAFEGQVDFVARQIDRYFGIFATRVSDVIPMSADYALVQN